MGARQGIEIGAEFLEQRRYERIHDDVRVERLPDLPVVARRELEGDLQVLPFDGQVFKEHWRWDRRDQHVVRVVGKQVVEHDVGTGIRLQGSGGYDRPQLGGYSRIADPLKRSVG